MEDSGALRRLPCGDKLELFLRVWILAALVYLCSTNNRYLFDWFRKKKRKLMVGDGSGSVWSQSRRVPNPLVTGELSKSSHQSTWHRRPRFYFSYCDDVVPSGVAGDREGGKLPPSYFQLLVISGMTTLILCLLCPCHFTLSPCCHAIRVDKSLLSIIGWLLLKAKH